MIAGNTSTIILQSIISNTEDLFAAISTDFTILAFNKPFSDAFTKVYGLPIRIGISLIDLLSHHPTEKNKVISYWKRALDGESYQIIEKFGDKNTTRQFAVSFYPILDECHNLIGAFQFVRNLDDE